MGGAQLRELAFPPPVPIASRHRGGAEGKGEEIHGGCEREGPPERSRESGFCLGHLSSHHASRVIAASVPEDEGEVEVPTLVRLKQGGGGVNRYL